MRRELKLKVTADDIKKFIRNKEYCKPKPVNVPQSALRYDRIQ